MHSGLAKAIDRWVIRAAARALSKTEGGQTAPAETVSRLLQDPDFFCDFAEAPANLAFEGERDFRFSSPVRTPWALNDTVHGKLFRAEPGWAARPVVILLHGWNAEVGYLYQFPYLARKLGRRGINTAMIELPYHGRRRPRSNGRALDFISNDLARMLEGTRQAIADIRALTAWLLRQGCPKVGYWGFSLGAWLAGLTVCADPRAGFAVLFTPLVELERAVAELEFCEPIRVGLRACPVEVGRLSLIACKPRVSPNQILFVESQYDLFAPPETVEEVARAWGGPDVWRVPHGHISALLSGKLLTRVADWIASR